MISGFWRNLNTDSERARQLLAARALGVINNVHYLFPQGGGPLKSFSTFAQIKPQLKTRDVIILGGVLREQVVAPEYVHDVLILGATNRAYQATDSGSPNRGNGGASWLPPTSPTATTPLLELTANNVGWRIEDIEFAAPEDDAAIKITNGGSGIGSGHHVLRNLMFLGGLIGIEDNGGFHNVLVEECLFHVLSGANGGGIVCTSTANAVPLRNVFRRNRFSGNQSNILASQSYSVIEDNRFNTTTAANINTVFNSGQGGNNHVVRNSFNIAAADFDPAGGVTGASTDIWYNYLTDAVESGQPAN